VSQQCRQTVWDVCHGLATEGNGACMACLSAQNFYPKDLQKNVQWRTKCAEKQGDYVERWCKISALVINVKNHAR
jgi:hypothetical protein